MIYEIKYAQYLSPKRSLLIEINRIKSLDPEKVRDIPYCATSPTVTLVHDLKEGTKKKKIKKGGKKTKHILDSSEEEEEESADELA
jgi:hypothetical protein